MALDKRIAALGAGLASPVIAYGSFKTQLPAKYGNFVTAAFTNLFAYSCPDKNKLSVYKLIYSDDRSL